jgi:hypothetical protein
LTYFCINGTIVYVIKKFTKKERVIKMKKIGIITLSALLALSPVVTTLTTITASAATVSASPTVLNMNTSSNYASATGSISRGGVATYTFTAPTTGNYTILLQNSTFNANGKIKDNTTGSSYQANDQAGYGFKMTQKANAGDQCTVTVWGVSSSASGTFSLRINKPN